MRRKAKTMYKKFFKRVIDTVIALFMLIILFPLLLITAVAIKLDSKGPVIFKQKRIGLHEKEFSILKFRSMAVDSEQKNSSVCLMFVPELQAGRRFTAANVLNGTSA